MVNQTLKTMLRDLNNNLNKCLCKPKFRIKTLITNPNNSCKAKEICRFNLNLNTSILISNNKCHRYKIKEVSISKIGKGNSNWPKTKTMDRLKLTISTKDSGNSHQLSSRNSKWGKLTRCKVMRKSS